LPGLQAENATLSEYEVKAAFLYNFAKFVNGRRTLFKTPEAPLIVGVLGDSPFNGELMNALNG